MPPQHRRQPADEGGKDRAIRPVQARLRVGSAQHGDFVAQHQKLDVLGRRRATEQHQQIQNSEEDKVEQTQRHGARSCLPARPANLPGQRRGPTSGTPQAQGSAAADARSQTTPLGTGNQRRTCVRPESPPWPLRTRTGCRPPATASGDLCRTCSRHLNSTSTASSVSYLPLTQQTPCKRWTTRDGGMRYDEFQIC
jgi:hypothetical protein